MLDEVLFGKTDMPADYQRPKEPARALSPDDVKRIMTRGKPAAPPADPAGTPPPADK